MKPARRKARAPSMRRRLLMLIAITVVPVIAVQAALYVQWWRAQYDQALRGNIDLARAMAQAFDTYVLDLRRNEHSIGTGMQWAPDNPQDRNAYVAHMQRDYSAVLSLSWAMPDGRIVASSDKALINDSLAERDYFQTLLKLRPVRDNNGEDPWIVSDLIRDPGQEPIFVVAQTIFHDGALQGVMVAKIHPEKLDVRVMNIELPPGTILTVFDRNGAEAFNSLKVPLSAQRTWLDRDPALVGALAGKPSVAKIVTPLDGSVRLAARVPVPGLASNGKNYVVGVGRPWAAVIAPLRQFLLPALAVLLGTIAASVAAAWWLARRLVRGARQLELQAEAIGQGDLTLRSSVHGTAELEELSESFNLMADRQQELQQQRQRSIDDLAYSNRELEQFAYVASHDLQEPLRMVTGYLQLIEHRYKDKLDKDGEEFINFAVDGAHRMSQLINDLLAFSRAGSPKWNPESVKLDSALEIAKRNLVATVDSSGAEITADRLPTVWADRGQMTQLFQNLLSNAIKFRSPDRRCRIHVSAKDRGNEWVIAVQDNGVGFEQDYEPKIFRIFQRLHSRQEYPGTGIGLAICKRIIERHHGEIHAEGRPGQGATFYFSLPKQEQS